MTSIIKLCPLSGGCGSEDPHCYILEVDNFTFLLDCGWDSKFSDSILKELKRHVSKIDAVLLSHPDHLHLGALPYAVGKLGLSCPIYATVPVFKMGQMFLYDLYQSRHNMEDFDLFSLDEVDRTFDMITQLKFNQTINLTGKGAGLTVTPIPAGHMIGGSIWKIVKEGEEDIVYAVDYNHKRERHLNGADVDKISRPSLLITDAFNAAYAQSRRRSRDEQLMTLILQTLRGGGNVLVSVDTAGRVLELAHMLDQLWQNKDSGLLAYSLALLNNVSYNVVEFAKSQIEWMSEKLMRTFEGRRNNPFAFKHLKLCHSMAEVNKVPSPKVVLASNPDMESGFARDLFVQWAGSGKNSIVLTSRSADGSLAADLVQNYAGAAGKPITVQVAKRVKLTGQELEEYRKKEKEKKQEDIMEDEESSSDEELLETTSAITKKKAHVKHDIILKTESVATVATRPKVFFKSTKTKYPMFPCYEDKIRWDDYGEIIKPEEWMDHTTAATASAAAAAADVETDPVGRLGAVDQDQSSEVPTKCVAQSLSFPVKAQIQFIDFEGRSDGESVLKLVQQVRPRRVIIVRGSDKACDTLAQVAMAVTAKMASDPEAANLTSNKRVLMPRTGEMVDATTESYIYQLRLPDSLMSTLEFQHAKDNAYLTWVDGVVTFHKDELMDIDNNSDKTEEDRPSLEPIQDQDRLPGHSANFVNELKLSDFKRVLLKHNIQSEFQGGVLFCGNGAVALRRHDSGRVTIEGCICDEYYQVRQLLYQQYAIV